MSMRNALLSLAALLSTQAVSADDGWLYYGGDQGGRHYSEAALIDRDNVSDLDVAWVHRSGDVERFGEGMENTSTQSTPDTAARSCRRVAGVLHAVQPGYRA